MMEAIRSSETSVLTRAARRHIPEDGILHSHRRENFNSYIALTGWTLYRRSDVSPVKYKLDFYIPEDDVVRRLLTFCVASGKFQYKGASKPNVQELIFTFCRQSEWVISEIVGVLVYQLLGI
jgi:hypothetical protein